MPTTEDNGYPRVPYQVTTVSSVLNKSTGEANSSTTSAFVPGNDRRQRYMYKQWVRTPNYRALKKSGAHLPDNSYEYQKRTMSYSPTNLTRVYQDNTYSSYENRAETYHPGYTEYDRDNFPENLDFLIAQAKFAVLEKAKGHQFNAPVAIAEVGKTINMVTNRATTMVYALRALRRGRFDLFLSNLRRIDRSDPRLARREWAYNKDFGKNPTQTAANFWLEFQYGWTPLMADVRNAVLTLMDTMERPDSIEGRISASRRYSGPLRTVSKTYESSPHVAGTLTSKYELSARVVWRYRISASDIPGRFGLLNPLEVAWELVPFSFVADWFLPIGDYLSALDAPMRFTHSGGTVGTLRSQVCTDVFTNSSYWNAGVRGDASASLVVVSRQPLGAIPIPRLSELSYDIGLSARRAISSIALLKQQLSRLAR